MSSGAPSPHSVPEPVVLASRYGKALERIRSLEEQVQTLQAAIDEGWEWKGEVGRLKEQLSDSTPQRSQLDRDIALMRARVEFDPGFGQALGRLLEQLEAQVAAGHECREHYMRLEEQLQSTERDFETTCRAWGDDVKQLESLREQLETAERAIHGALNALEDETMLWAEAFKILGAYRPVAYPASRPTAATAAASPTPGHQRSDHPESASDTSNQDTSPSS